MSIETGLASPMNALNKQHHQPLNPFRTQLRTEDHHGVLFSNPIFQVCYVAAVGTLLIAVSVVAWTTFSQLPNPQEDSALLAGGPHRLAVTDLTDLKILNKPPVRMGGGVRSQSIMPPPQQKVPSQTIAGALLEKMVPVQPIVVNARSMDYGKDDDESSKEDSLSFTHDDETEDTSIVHDAEDLLLRPADANLKILGETKEQVKIEIDQEEYSDHAFGLQQDHGTNPDADDESADPEAVDEGRDDRGGQRADKGDASGDHEVHVLRRKGELDALLAGLQIMDESATIDKSVNATSRLQSNIHISTVNEASSDQEVDGEQQIEEDQQLEQTERESVSTGGEEKLHLRHKRLPPIDVTADE